MLNKKNSVLRIIGGKFKGRKITFTPTNNLRPTTDRIRETVFNWLQPYIMNRICLDLFAGTGALGLEACSRGAKHVTFVEQNTKTIVKIQTLLDTWKIENAQTLNTNAFTYLNQHFANPYDLIFLDPPFNSQLLNRCAVQLSSNNLPAECLLYTEHPASSSWQPPKQWKLLKTKTSGHVCYSLWVLVSPSTP